MIRRNHPFDILSIECECQVAKPARDTRLSCNWAGDGPNPNLPRFRCHQTGRHFPSKCLSALSQGMHRSGMPPNSPPNSSQDLCNSAIPALPNSMPVLKSAFSNLPLANFASVTAWGLCYPGTTRTLLFPSQIITWFPLVTINSVACF